jgi:hypothetical protein
MASLGEGTMSTLRLILVPGIVTALVTLLRLVGELNQWSRAFFNPEAGGGMAIVGIAWLVPVFGIYFAWKLHSSEGIRNGGRSVGFGLLAIVAFIVLAFGLNAAMGLDPNAPSLLALGNLTIASLVALAIAYYGTGALGRVLFAYGLAARIPVVLVMLVAILGNWGTHYDVLPPGVTLEVSPLTKWFLIGVVPQLTIWMAFTVALGALFGGVALVVAERREAAARPAGT